MLRKRIIFTLLFSNGSFALSRNFRLQTVGDLDWLERNYCFSKVAQFIDELIILDVSRKEKDYKEFRSVVNHISDSCFVPVAAGGGIDTIEKARGLMNAGADKIVINSSLFDEDLINALAYTLGKQSIIGSIDISSYSKANCLIATKNGQLESSISTENLCSRINNIPLGEIYINSVANDGTGNGLDMGLVELFGNKLNTPIILAGGIGNKVHVTEGLNHLHINAVATAHLFNFIGDGLSLTRKHAVHSGISLAKWPSYESLLGKDFRS